MDESCTCWLPTCLCSPPILQPHSLPELLGHWVCRRVSFAPGPLQGTADGHPPHEGVQTATRAAGATPPAPLDAGLTPAHVHTLEVGRKCDLNLLLV